MWLLLKKWTKEPHGTKWAVPSPPLPPPPWWQLNVDRKYSGNGFPWKMHSRLCYNIMYNKLLFGKTLAYEVLRHQWCCLPWGWTSFYMKSLDEAVRRLRPRCHQYAGDSQLYLTSPSASKVDLVDPVLVFCRGNRLDEANKLKLKLNYGLNPMLYGCLHHISFPSSPGPAKSSEPLLLRDGAEWGVGSCKESGRSPKSAHALLLGHMISNNDYKYVARRGLWFLPCAGGSSSFPEAVQSTCPHYYVFSSQPISV